jgi:O-antigen/teichoic acid export membrane protein
MILRRVLRNVLSNYALAIVSSLIGLILTPLLFDYLHPVNYAVLAFAIAFAALIESVHIGIATALVRFVSSFAAHGLHDELRRLSSTFFFILAGLGVFMAGFVGLFSRQAVLFFHIRSAGGASGFLIVALIGFCLLFQVPCIGLRGYLEGCQDFHLANAVDIGGHILRGIVVVAMLGMGFGLLPIAAVFPSIDMLRFLGLMLISRYASIPFRPRASEFSIASLKSVRAFAALCLVEDAVTPLFAQSDTFLAARLLTLPELAILVIARRIPWAISRLAQVTLDVAYPMLSSSAAREDRETVRKFMLISARNTLAIVVPLCTVLYVWTQAVLRMWVGSEVLSGVSVFRAFLVFAIFAGLQHTPLTLLYATGKIGFSVGVYLSMLGGVVLLGPVVCLKGGLAGLALLYASVQALATMLFFWRALKVAAIPIAWWVKKTFMPVIVAEIPTLASLLISFRLVPHSLVGIGLSSAVALGFFLGIYTLMLTGTKPQPWRSRMRDLLTGTD